MSEIEKVDIPGCLIDEDTFRAMCARIDALETPMPRPATPVITPGGNATFQSGVAILGEWANRDSYDFQFRVLVQQDPGTGFGWVNVPIIAGLQRPQIYPVNGYRFPTTAVQQDNSGGASGDGAAPRGQVMGEMFGHWSNTRRLYCPYFRRDEEYRAYCEAIVRYYR